MEETIKEKAMRAWAQERRVAVSIIGNGGIDYVEHGKIITIQPADNSFKLLEELSGVRHGHYFKDIRDIAFPADEVDPPDVAKERWGIVDNSKCFEIRSEPVADGMALVISKKASLKQIRVMAAAPQMLEALEMIYRSDLLIGEGYSRIEALIKKARGE